MFDIPEIKSVVDIIGEDAFNNLAKAMDISKKEVRQKKEGGEVSEVYDKYGSLSGYRMTLFTEKKGKLTQVFRIGGRISRNDAKQLAEDELSRLKRKYKID